MVSISQQPLNCLLYILGDGFMLVCKTKTQSYPHPVGSHTMKSACLHITLLHHRSSLLL